MTVERTMKHPGSKSVGWALVQAARLHRGRMGDKLASVGLFAGQEQVLQALAAAGPMTMGELAAILRVRPPTASKTISRLATLSLVERHTEPGDARIVRVRLTEEGQARAAARAFEAIARQPAEAPTISRNLYVGLAMIESQALYVLIVALILLFANPLVGRLPEAMAGRSGAVWILAGSAAMAALAIAVGTMASSLGQGRVTGTALESIAEQPEARTEISTALFISLALLESLALYALIRGQYPQDALYVIGFSLYARELDPDDMPSVVLTDRHYGTNMQHALQLARRLLARHRGGNRQVVMITDGEPTAHLEGGDAYFDYPTTRRTWQLTQAEVLRCAREGVTINTFMLEDSPGLVRFVTEMSRINRGRAFFVQPDRLGEYVLVDYLARKQKRVG